MRHRNTVKKMGRTSAHRKATLANLSAALLENKHIQTTEAKARIARRVTERLITLAKKDTLHARRLALQQLRQKHIVKILFEDVSPRYVDRNGGYTRMVKLGRRFGDGASMAVVELVGFETASKKQKEKEAKKEEAKKKKESKKEKGFEKAQTKEQAKKTKGAKDSKESKSEKTAKESKKESKKDIKEGKDKKKKASKDKKEEK
jgi:large subunit ribosomal protein L17